MALSPGTGFRRVGVPVIVMAKKAPRLGSSSGKFASGVPSSDAQDSSAVPASIRSRADSTVSISIHAKPGSKVSGITGVGEDNVGVQINAPARDGEANEALIEYMAEVIGVRKRDVSLSSGARSREKVLIVQGKSAEHVYSALKSLCNK